MGYLDQFHHFFVGPENGPKLVFLHGLLGFSANWRSVARQFESTHRVLVYDQRGHGRSIQPQTGYAPEDYANDLLAIIDELGWPSISLVGHSMGGRNALNFAARFPDRVEKLVIEDIGPIGNPAAAEGYRQMFALVPTPFVSREEALNFMSHDFAEVWPPPIAGGHGDSDDRAAAGVRSTGAGAGGGATLGLFLYSNFEERPDGSVSWRNSMDHMIESVLRGHAEDRWKDWEGLRMPTLLIRGSKSQDLLAPVFDEMLRRNPRVHGVVVEGAGHWIHFEKMAEFVRVLREFLGDIKD